MKGGGKLHVHFLIYHPLSSSLPVVVGYTCDSTKLPKDLVHSPGCYTTLCQQHKSRGGP